MDLNLGDTQLIIDECKRGGLSKEQAAYVLATAYWETAHTLKPVKEAYWLSEDWRRNNLRYYPYYGRGYVQLTWKENYEKVGRIYNEDLVNKPDLALEAYLASRVIVAGSKGGWFTGKKLEDYICEGKKDFVNARRIINGTDKAHEIANIAYDYEKLLVDYSDRKATYTILKNPQKTNPFRAFINAIKQIIRALGITK